MTEKRFDDMRVQGIERGCRLNVLNVTTGPIMRAQDVLSFIRDSGSGRFSLSMASLPRRLRDLPRRLVSEVERA